MSVPDHRPPAAPRRGAQPRGRALRPPRRLPPLRPRHQDGRSGSPRRIGDRDIVHLRTSPLERAQETGAPLAAVRGLTPVIDARVIESSNKFEGLNFSDGARTFLRRPRLAPLVQPAEAVVGRAVRGDRGPDDRRVDDARDAAAGHEAVIVSHQLPIWTTRLFVEKRRYLHDPRNRQCTLCSLTSLHFDGDRLTQVRYSEPAGDLIPVTDRTAPFSAGGAAQEDRP